MSHQISNVSTDEQSSANPFSRLSTELIQKIWLHSDIPGQLNLRLVDHFIERNVRQVYADKWFKRRAHLFTKRSLQRLLDIASSEYLAPHVQQIKLVLVDFIFAKGSWSESPRTPVVDYLLQSKRGDSSINHRYQSQVQRASIWESETTWLWEEGNGAELLEQVFEKIGKHKLDSVAITSALNDGILGEAKPFGAHDLQQLAILTPSDGQADLDNGKNFLPVLSALVASKSSVSVLELDELHCTESFLDGWTNAHSLWINLHSLRICLFELFKHEYDGRRKALTSLLSKCAKLEDLRLEFETEYDRRDQGECFLEVVQSLQEVPLRRLTVITMAMREVDLKTLLRMNTLQSVQLWNVRCSGVSKQSSACVHWDERSWKRYQGWMP